MDALDKYILDNSTPQDELLRELEHVTFRRAINPHMISGHVQGKLLEMITRMINPDNVLEIGTFTGYSTLSIAAGLQDGAVIDTIDPNDELEDIYKDFFARSPHGSKIHTHIGSALAIAPKLGKKFDLVFVDGGKREYPEYYEMLMGDGRYSEFGALVKSGSYIVVDNVLWYGNVANESKQSVDTRAIIEMNNMIVTDPRVENVILPIRDGLNLIRVK